MPQTGHAGGRRKSWVEEKMVVVGLRGDECEVREGRAKPQASMDGTQQNGPGARLLQNGGDDLSNLRLLEKAKDFQIEAAMYRSPEPSTSPEICTMVSTYVTARPPCSLYWRLNAENRQ
jgi:hypothetical protein